MPSLRLLPEAQADLESAFAWYKAQDPADVRLLARLHAALDAAYSRILDGPERYPFLAQPVRRVLLRRFPYAIYYVVEPHAVVVIAVLHHKRDPRVWQRRALTRR